MPGQTQENRKPFLKIIGGKIAQEVEKNTQGAKLREYETVNLKTGIKTKGSKWELFYIGWTGFLRSINIKESEYGQMCYIEVDDAILVIHADSRYFADFVKKIFSADLNKSITITPYDFEVDGKKRKGISLKQDNVKLPNYFYNPEKKKNLHKFPEVDEKKKDDMGKKYWDVYFAEVTAFLVNKLKTIEIPERKTESIQIIYPSDDENPKLDDLPF